ncbi:hypothetical protein [Enterobacter asburiae]|uniref:hypothetical protein n=1 Tax=Enterobacter asburiae TaxID=61645 RepID=UPI0021D39E23|nr:hypothetical protein [Enterobacter asburiae]MCU6244140.1 hypothetical protein [Enterobacter asburiae]
MNKKINNVFFQNASMITDPASGLMRQQQVPISAIPINQYDVSVRDFVMKGQICEILNQLDNIHNKKASIVTLRNYGTLKIHINTINKYIDKVSLYPVAQTAIHNANMAIAGGLSVPIDQVIKLVGLDTITIYSLIGKITEGKILDAYLKEFISTTTVGDLINIAAEKLFEKSMKNISKNNVTLRPSIMEADKKPFVLFVKALRAHIKPLISPSSVERGMEVSICQYPYISPEYLQNKYSMLNNVKNSVCSLFKTDYLIKVGSNFNSNHAGIVIDLETHSIAMDELMFFLSVFDSKKKLVNCFFNSGFDQC